VLAETERFTEEVTVHNEDTESDDERASSDDGATPKKGTRGKSKKTTNGTKEAGAATPVGASIASFWCFDLGFTTSLPRQTNGGSCVAFSLATGKSS